MNTGSVLAQFTISLSMAVNEPVSVDWFTSDGTAKAGVDYAANRGTVVFAPGQVAKTVDILVYGRAVGTEDRSFYVEMLPPTNAILGAPIGECVIHVDTTGSQPVTEIIVPTGPRGAQGKSAYQTWLDLGNTGTEQDFIDSLKPSAEDIADDVLPLLNVGSAQITAEGTDALAKPDSTTVKAVARRVAFASPARIATVTLANGNNTITAGNLTGDPIDFNASGFVPKVLHNGALTEPSWSVLDTGQLVIYGATAGDVLYAVQYDTSSAKRRYAIQEQTESSYYQKLLSFEAGSPRPLTSKRDVLLYAAGNSGAGEYYYWDGAFPKTVPAGSTPASSGGVGIGMWISAGNATTRSDLGKSDGFKLIGGVNSFAELRQLLPTAAGIHVKLHGWRSGSTLGAGEFIAVSGDGTDDGGIVARVNTQWYWKRIFQGDLEPEMFGAYGDATNDDSAALNNCFSSAGRLGTSVSGNRQVTYLCSDRLTVEENVRVQGNRIMRIVRGPSVNQDLDFLTLLAGSSLIGVTIEGQRNQSLSPAEVVLVRIASNVHIDKCYFAGSRGYGIVANGVPGIRITNTEVRDCASGCIALFGDGSANSTDFEIVNCKFRDMGAGSIYVGGYSFGKIDKINAIGTYIGGPNSRMYVTTNTNGVVTTSSGPNFSGLKPGMFIVLPGGTEHRITNVSSATNITVSPPPPSNGTFRAIAGTGDLLGIQSCAFVVVSNSYISTGITYGTGGGTMVGSTIECNYCSWENNVIQNTGKNGINLSQKNAACNSNSIKGNTLIATGSGGKGASSTYLLPGLDTAAIALVQGDAGRLWNTDISDNNIITFAVDLGAGESWLYMSGMSAGSVTCSGNTQNGYADGWVRGDILNVAMTGYGAGATATLFLSNGESIMVSIQAGTSPTASPYFNVTKAIRARTQPVIMAQIATTSGVMAHCWGMQSSTSGVWTIGRNTTPTGIDTYFATAV